MVKHIVKKTWILGVIGLVAMLLFLGGSSKPHGVAAGGGGVAAAGTVAPLLSCPNVDGSAENGVRVGDIIAVVHAFFHDWPNTNYYPLYDLVDPYNSTTGTGGKQRVDDILNVVGQFFHTCPLVDTQIAQASLWGIQNIPVMENATALHAMHYYEASSDVPGQGVHYVNMDNWDGTFNPAAPEGLVYTPAYMRSNIEDPGPNQGSCSDGIDNGSDGVKDAFDPDCNSAPRIAAQLYVVDGNAVGWGTNGATSCCPPAVHGIDLESATSGGPNCSPACSWAGTEGWHVHHYLCTVHIGTASAVAAPAFATQGSCATFGGGEPLCTVPITATPCYQWGKDIGWMGHLWNWVPNANQVPDGTGTNGRFADCYPDAEGWTAYTCPA